VFLPWQFYILKAFPAESAISYAYNVKHMTDDLGHPGTVWYHIHYLSTSYHSLLLPLLGLGMIAVFFYKEVNRRMSISFVAMILVIFAFFSFLVKTKMPALVSPVSPLMFILMAFGIYTLIDNLGKLRTVSGRLQTILWILILLISGWLLLKPATIVQYRSETNEIRNRKIHNSTVYKNLQADVTKERIILNCKIFEHVELMFFQNTRAYHAYPEEYILDSLQQIGFQFAAFQNVPGQKLTPRIADDPDILMLSDSIR
jgi:hypothetical protein